MKGSSVGKGKLEDFKIFHFCMKKVADLFAKSLWNKQGKYFETIVAWNKYKTNDKGNFSQVSRGRPKVFETLVFVSLYTNFFKTI